MLFLKLGPLWCKNMFFITTGSEAYFKLSLQTCFKIHIRTNKSEWNQNEVQDNVRPQCYLWFVYVASIWPLLVHDLISLPLEHFLHSYERSKGIMTKDSPHKRPFPFLVWWERSVFNGCLEHITPQGEINLEDSDAVLRLWRTRCALNSESYTIQLIIK